MQATDLIIYMQDKDTKEKIVFASVKYTSNQQTANSVANNDGYLELKAITYPIQITCTAMGYETRKVNITEKVCVKMGTMTFIC